MSFQKAQVIFPSNFASIFSVIKHNSSVLFLTQTLYTLVKFSQLMCNFLRFSSARIKIHQISHVNLNCQVNSSSIFASFSIFMTHNPPVNFKLINFHLWTKESHQSPNCETFKCSGENFPNSPCYFLNHKSVFLQILHHSLVS